MTLEYIVNELGVKVISGKDLSAEASGVYVCDLLSHVMTKAQPGNIWITVQTNVNIVAVATLCEVSCILIPENIKPDDTTVKKAEAEDVTILSTSMSAYQFITEYNKL